jgi:transposase
VAAWPQGASQGITLATVPNTADGLEQLAQAVEACQHAQQATGVHLTVEPTARYEAQLAYFAHARSWRVSVVNPANVREFARSWGQRAKTDQQDALMLARFTAERHPALWQPPPDALDELELLVSRRRDVVSMLQAERNRKRSFAVRARPVPVVQQTVQDSIDHLVQALAKIDQAIADLFKRHPPMAEQVERLDSLPGVGPKTLPPLMAILMHWDLVTDGQGSGRELTAFVGLDPTVYHSGKSVHRHGSISKKGNAAIRAALYMAALGALRNDNALHRIYDGMVARGKRKMVALVACSRKLLMWAWRIFKSGCFYDPALHAIPS